MSGFVASPPTPAADSIIDGDGWWPALSIAAFQDVMRMPREVTMARARDALLAAMIETARELASWQTAQIAAGATSLDAIEGPGFGGEKRLVILWRRAVHGLAAADLADTQSDITATADGRDRTAQRAVSADELRRNATHAIRAIKGAGSRNRVALK